VCSEGIRFESRKGWRISRVFRELSEFIYFKTTSIYTTHTTNFSGAYHSLHNRVCYFHVNWLFPRLFETPFFNCKDHNTAENDNISKRLVEILKKAIKISVHSVTSLTFKFNVSSVQAHSITGTMTWTTTTILFLLIQMFGKVYLWFGNGCWPEFFPHSNSTQCGIPSKK
jgi:hypothetical protein